MAGEDFLVNPLGWAVLVLLGTSFVLVYRVLAGPTLPDRIVGLNTITTKVVVVIALLAGLLEEYFLLDLAIVLLMVNAVGGLILAKHFERRGLHD
ncbi:MAG: monovalent cation/H+ antiporter complex subunit F [Candidatus Thermoplasmatota archaeon]|nr:monovalent cation/H+ antiporter complex subunit F [Candidatus Thermoplasmatota archaeon]